MFDGNVQVLIVDEILDVDVDVDVDVDRYFLKNYKIFKINTNILPF